jgi:hypothetical protein
MTNDLTDDEDQMPMEGREGGGGMNEDDDLDMEMDPRSGRGDARPKGSNKHGRANAGDRQQRKQSAAYNDDDGDF